MAHSHGEVTHRDVFDTFFRDFLSQVRKLLERRPRIIRIIGKRAHGHQSPDPHAVECGDAFDEVKRLFRQNAELRRFVRRMDFHEDINGAIDSVSPLLDFFRNSIVVHRVNQMDVVSDEFDFVALKVAYEMPPHAIIVQPVAFLVKLLSVVLTDVKKTRRNRLPDLVNSKGLCDTEEENVFGLSAASEANLPDAILDDFYVLRDHFATIKD